MIFDNNQTKARIGQDTEIRSASEKLAVNMSDHILKHTTNYSVALNALAILLAYMASNAKIEHGVVTELFEKQYEAFRTNGRTGQVDA